MKNTDSQLPKVGILADDLVQQHNLRTALTGFGLNVIINITPKQQTFASLTDHPDVWVVDVHGEDDETFDWLDALMNNNQPVLLGIDAPPQKQSLDYAKWEKKLYSKLCSFDLAMPDLATVNQAAPTHTPTPEVFTAQQFQHVAAKELWVIAASMGGPDAVKQFFDALPAGLPVAFVYAQHIDPAFENTLGQTIGRHSEYQFKNFLHGDAINYGEVLIAPIQNEFFFDGRLHLHSSKSPWPGPYGPSIDQVITNVHNAYGCDAGYIIFSGMGSDGANAIINQLAEDVPIWAQSPESCICSSMPESAIATGKVNFTGTPQQLAEQLVQHLQQQWETSHV